MVTIATKSVSICKTIASSRDQWVEYDKYVVNFNESRHVYVSEIYE